MKKVVLSLALFAAFCMTACSGGSCENARKDVRAAETVAERDANRVEKEAGVVVAKAGKKTREVEKKAENGVAGTYGKVKKKTGEVAGAVKDKTVETYDRVKDGAVETYDKVKDKTTETYEVVKEKVVGEPDRAR